MSRQISEQGGDAALQKRIRQAVYDIRYKARKDELDLRHAYSQYIGKSGLDQTGKEAVQNKLFGKSQQAESNVLEAASSNKYKVRVSDNETGKTYIRYAKRDKISKLRSKGSVEMTGHGSPKGAKNAPSVKKDPKKKLKSAGPDPKKVALSKKKPGVVALPKKAKPVQVQVVDPKKMEKNETDVVGSAVKSLRKIVRKEAFIADATAVAPPVNKKITGEKVDNSKLIKVFPQDGSDPQIGSIKSSYKPVGEVVAEIVNPQQVDEVVGQAIGGILGATAGKDLAAQGLKAVAGAATKAGAPKAIAKALTSKAAPKIAGAAVGSAAGEVLDPFKKNKDKNPVAAAAGGAAGSAIHGAIKSSYKPVGQVVAEILANEDMNKGYEVTNADKKGNTPAWQGYLAGKKKKDGTPLYRKAAHMEEEVGVSTSAAMEKAKKEAKLQSKERGAVKKAKRWQDNDGDGKWYEKGVDVKKEEFADPFYKQVEYDDDDPRSMKTKWNLVKNRLRSLGLKCSNELEGDTIEEGKAGSAVTGTLGNVVGGTVGAAVGGPAGAAVGSVAGGALGAAAGARKGKKKSAAVGGALGSALGPVGSGVGAAIGASNELEGDTLAEDEAIREARRADKMGIARKKVTYDKGEETRNPNPDRGAAPSFKPEGGSRAGSIAKSRARSLGDARRKANRKGANLAYGKREGRLATFAANKRDSDSDLGSQKAVTDTGAHKDKQGFRQVHKYGERGDKRRPQQNPKHTANTQKEHHQVDAKGKVIEHGDGTPSSIEESKGYVCESTLVRNILTKKN